MDYIRNLMASAPEERIRMMPKACLHRLPRVARLAPAAFAVALAGCASTAARPPEVIHEGHASWRAVETPDTVHYALALGEVSSGAAVLSRVTPDYPPSELATCPPAVEVIAKLIVDTRGRVTEVRPDNAEAAAPERRPFLEATRSAAMQWRFEPLQINHWSADANGGSYLVDSRNEPFSIDYVFRFSCQAGRARVSTGDKVAAR